MSGSGLEVEERIARRGRRRCAAASRLDGLATEYPDHLELVDSLRAELDTRRPQPPSSEDGGDLDAAVQERLEHQEIRLALVAAERDAVIRLRDEA